MSSGPTAQSTGEAVKYIQEVQKRFPPESTDVSRKFLSILGDYARGLKSIDEVYGGVQELFENDPDLLDGFAKFLPKK